MTAAEPGSMVGVERSAVGISVLTAVSRATGYVRVVVAAAVLGTSYLGNVYQSANLVPNMLFELLAAGAMQAVLVPTLVELLSDDRRDDAERVAGSILGLAWAVLGALVVLGVLLAPWIVEGLVAGVDDPEVRRRQVELGTFFLWLFLPQALLYAAGAVAGAVLNAHQRFNSGAIAPALSSLVVTAAYLGFALLRDGAEPSLTLSLTEKVVLAGGTTLGVVALCGYPFLMSRRSTGFRLVPRRDWSAPEMRGLVRRSAWAVLFLAATQVLLLVVVQQANGIEGGVVVFGVAQIFFLLPHALLAVPVLTARFPLLARAAHRSRHDEFDHHVEAGLRSITYLVLPAAVVMGSLAPSLAQLALYGEAVGRSDEVADAIAAFAPGTIGYGILLFLTRVFYAKGDARTPALVNCSVTLLGTVLMLVGVAIRPEDRITVLAGSYAVAHLVGAALLWGLLVRSGALGAARGRLGRRLGLPLLRRLVGALSAGVVAMGVRQLMWSDGRLSAAAVLALGGALGIAVHLGVVWAVGGPGPADALRSLGAAPGRRDEALPGTGEPVVGLSGSS